MNSTVVKAFEILRYIADRQGQVRLKDLTRDLGMNKTTVFRFLETLEHLNLVEKRGQTFFLGLGLLDLGRKVPLQTLIIDPVEPLLKRASQALNETINLAMLQDNHALYLYKVESQRRIQFSARPGDQLKLHCTALGKAILSALPEQRLNALMPTLDFQPMTDHSILSAKALQIQLDEVKKRGYTEECEEVEDGLICVGVPLNIPALDFYGALSISGSANRFTPDHRRFLGERLQLLKSDVEAVLKDLY